MLEQCVFELQKNEYDVFSRYWADPAEAAKSYIPFLLDYLEKNNGKMFVVEMDNKIVGFAAATVQDNKKGDPCRKEMLTAYVTDIVTLKDYRKNGVGRELLKETEKYAIKMGAEYISLNVQIGNDALDFYHKEGYQERIVWMDKKLSNG